MPLAEIGLGFLLDKAWKLVTSWKNSTDERKELNLILQKALRKFIVDWEQFTNHMPSEFIVDETKSLLSRYRKQLLDLTIHVEHLIKPELRDKLYELADKMQEAIGAINGLGAFPTKDIGNEAKDLAKSILESHLATES